MTNYRMFAVVILFYVEYAVKYKVIIGYLMDRNETVCNIDYKSRI